MQTDDRDEKSQRQSSEHDCEANDSEDVNSTKDQAKRERKPTGWNNSRVRETEIIKMIVPKR